MATCRDIVTSAYRMAGVIGLASEPNAEELAFGLSALQSIFDRVADGRDYMPVLTSGTYEAGENERIRGASAVTLPTTITDDGAERAPKDLAFVQYDLGAGYVTYACDRGAWVRLDALAYGDPAPFASRNRDGLSALLALELSETYPGATIGPMRVQQARRFQSIFGRDNTLDPEYF